MARWYGLWWGGAEYSAPDPGQDVEVFDSLKEAESVLWSRVHRGAYYVQKFRYASGEEVWNLTPMADETGELRLYRGDPTEAVDPVPDRVLTFGPRGGVRVS